MSALLESRASIYKATLGNQVSGFFKHVNNFNDMEHTHIARVRLRCWGHSINCVRYSCTLDWYFNRYLVDEDDDNDTSVNGKFQEYLILRVLCRSPPSISAFNTENMISSINQQLENSKFISDIKKYYTASKT